ncbi:heavy metal translocating P-type ATPase [Christiangramia forsetii]|uniref:Heavy metal-transporting P-type ATPase-most likely copper-transporting n=2 Tax=Christiangramia forsetii TaxID=411153 RepID=A0M1B0_CHRFK|nr:heavy metal translocating P-type ATPase metal-binding domain-containing protein [Christiangramia forsetii]GGG42951.1 ATPase [Christiangramia forsetii]CAL66405.1 heavy metal-transporting P-type ATPase-most likely copper-transporting [Christiangramia forsetii KT0803]
MESCFHCGDDCLEEIIAFDDKSFCCSGCKTVFEILNTNDLSYYYELEKAPGISPKIREGKYDYLENSEIIERLLEFDHDNTQIVSFSIPSIHCSSCIWILENLNKLHKGIKSSQVDFPKKTIRLSFSSEEMSLKNLVLLLVRIGYEPNISLDNYDANESSVDRSLIYKLGVAGFAFGNIMFLSFPEYFEINEFWLEQFKHLFRWLMFIFSLPVVFYSGRDYFISAFKGLRSGILNIDVPIALGISVLFIRSTVEIPLDLGTGFFDSLSGLVFFLLLGKFFQQKTYSFLSFERDYKSYFPIAITRVISKEGKQLEEQIQVYKIEKGDRIIIRNEELIPMDAILIKGDAKIDYSFVTGEAEPVSKISGDKLYAGGRQQGGIIELEALRPVKQSYLTELWSDEVFSKDKNSVFQNLTNQISKRFTYAVLCIAILSTTFWMFYDPSKAWNVFTAVLIIACPCAIALAAPFTLGNMLRIFGKNHLYLKDANIIEKTAEIDTVVFDKTGTITTNDRSRIEYEGLELTSEEKQLLGGSLRASNHPLSRSLYNILDKHNISTPESFTEHTGQGLETTYKNLHLKVGSPAFVDQAARHFTELQQKKKVERTSVYISTNNQYKGCFTFHNSYRNGLSDIFKELSVNRKIIILSGDNDGERARLQEIVPQGTNMFFNQKPGDKLQYIKDLQSQGRKVMMVGDGLNDAGALAQSDVGIVISEDINVFSPACDGILDAKRFKDLGSFFDLSGKAIKVIQLSFLLSLFYNLIGLGFAVTGNLMPVVAAILMPLSSISIVVFTTLVTQIITKDLKIKRRT